MTHLLFAGDDFYADGGAADLKGAYHDEEAARAAFADMDRGHSSIHGYRYDWAHILDVESLIVIAIRQGDYSGLVSEKAEKPYTVKTA